MAKLFLGPCYGTSMLLCGTGPEASNGFSVHSQISCKVKTPLMSFQTLSYQKRIRLLYILEVKNQTNLKYTYLTRT